MNTNLTLESVLADFQLWRQTKTSPRNRIPEDLKQKAVALLIDMSPGKITKALGISSTMLKTWGGQKAQCNDTTAEIEFIALPAEPQPLTRDCDDLKLELTQSNGNHWCLQGNISLPQLNAFISATSALPGGVK